MEFLEQYILTVIEWGGILAPLLFICFHLIRPLLFLPVVFICISGGVLFGPILGTIYSIIGITLSSIIFYRLIHIMPKQLQRFLKLKQKCLGKYTELSAAQIAMLRLIPFIHFHLLSLCLVEITSNMKDYTKLSFLSNIPLALIYTSIGGWISNLSPVSVTGMLLIILIMIYLLRRKEIRIKWEDFFQMST